MQCCVGFFEWGQNDTGHDYLGRIIELFEKEDSSEWFTVQWFFRASETAMGDQGLNLDKQRVFFSELHDDNPLDCITEKKTVIRLPSEVRSMMPPLFSANKILFYIIGYILH
jgi:DNA (cytosine-5)-methyltransferase 1